MGDLFRKSALDTMSTPEQLDKQVKIMRPASWIIYIILVVGMITFILWGFVYNISNGVNINGVVFTNNNIVNINAQHKCIVTDVLVSEGEYINVGDVIAVVSCDEMLDNINAQKERLKSIDENTDEYKNTDIKIRNLVDEYIATTVIKSSSSGSIQSIATCGSALEMGTSIASIMLGSGYKEMIAYVPMQTAQNMSLGMKAQISPSYASREEYGYMTGAITRISDIPVTQENILAKMGTLSYVENILPDTSFVEVRIKIDLDSTSSNGYKWSNKKGKNLSIELGTQCSIIIVTNEYRPIELLLG